ncbi:MAG: serine/threonine protein kinase [Cyanobacteria bacterium Co-bin13]|nr:serine/threonine protein kinase [Cyanobacteria bacterium Co-bin13]
MTALCLNPACPQPQNPDGHFFCQSCGQPLRLGQRYLALKLLGQGGFGRTFLAVNAGTGSSERCVIKQNWGRDRNSADSSQRFRAEAERLRELGSHPQIPQLLGYFELESGQFLVQEYIPGPNLEDLLARQGAFDEQRLRRLLMEVLPVLEFIHGRQVIHRDIKPANLIAPAQPGPLALVDFGASKAVDAASGAKKTGTVIGSAGYVAPEQALGQATFASDLYSLGVTCIYLLTGLHPFDLYSISEDRWIWRTYVQSPVSLKLARTLDQMLARSLRQRYASADAVLADLTRLPQLGTLPGVGRLKRSRRARQAAQAADAPVTPGWQRVRTITQPGGVVNGLAVSPNGRAIATGSSDQSVRLWDLSDGSLIRTFAKRLGFWGAGHQDAVTGVSFSPDGYTLYSASQDGVLKAWDLATYQLDWQQQFPGWGTATLALSPDGQTLITAGGEGQIQVWDVPSGELRTTLIHHQDWVSSLALSPDGQQLVSGSWDKTLRLWHVPTGRLLQTLTTAAARVTAVAWDISGKKIYSGDSQGTVQIWQPQQSSQGRLLSQQADAITILAPSPEGRWLATGSADGTLNVWDMQARTRSAILKHSWGVRSAAFTADGQTLISSGADETLQIWQPLPNP